MPNINITVAAKIATNMSPGVAIVCGNSDYTLTFTFDAEWAAHPLKTARFVYTRDGQVHYTEIAFSGNVAAVPVLSGITDVYVGVYAGDLRTTTPARILCDRSILCGGGTHEEPPEDIYNQILAACNELIAVAGGHPTRTDNPHGVTWDQVGAAPAGYGLGEDSRWLDSDELFANLTTNGWDTWGISLADPNKPFGMGKMLVVNHSGNKSCTQIAFNATSSTAMKIRSQENDGTWGEWEWVNPPMNLGVEYRTTERYQGKPVYAKVFEFGAMPNATKKTVSNNVSNAAAMINWEIIRKDSGGNMGGSENITNVLCNRADFTIVTTVDLSAFSVNVYIRYTKTTD